MNFSELNERLNSIKEKGESARLDESQTYLDYLAKYDPDGYDRVANDLRSGRMTELELARISRDRAKYDNDYNPVRYAKMRKQ